MLQQQAASETRPLTASPKQTLVGRWLNPENGGTLTYHANGSIDMEIANISLKSPSGSSEIPNGMVLANGRLLRGKSSWQYQGDSKRGRVFITFDDYETGDGARVNGEVIFVNSRKVISLMNGQASYMIKMQ